MDYRKTVEHLRSKAEIFKKSNYAVDGVVKCFEESADTIENLIEELKQFKDKQEQGLLLELPVPIGGIVWTWEYPTITDENGESWVVCNRKKATVVSKKFDLFMLSRLGSSYFLTEEEALAKMGGK